VFSTAGGRKFFRNVGKRLFCCMVAASRKALALTVIAVRNSYLRNVLTVVTCRAVESESEGISAGVGVGAGKNVPTPTSTSV
jgi:hypothetical protein